jgi:hypothetical protein
MFTGLCAAHENGCFLGIKKSLFVITRKAQKLPLERVLKISRVVLRRGGAAGFVAPRLQISGEYAPSSRLAIHSAALAIPFPIYFHNTLLDRMSGWGRDWPQKIAKDAKAEKKFSHRFHRMQTGKGPESFIRKAGRQEKNFRREKCGICEREKQAI